MAIEKFWLQHLLSRFERIIKFEVYMTYVSKSLNTVQGRRFVEMSMLLREHLINLVEVPSVSLAMSTQLLNVLKSCDDITYEEEGAAEAYAMLHFLDRFHRFQLIYEYLDQLGIMPKPKINKVLNLLDIGTGPGPSMFAASDYCVQKFGQPTPDGSGSSRKFRVDYVERSTRFRNWLHHFTKYANGYSLTDEPWYVPYQHGSFHDFGRINFNPVVRSYEGQDDDGMYLYDEGIHRHRYDLITFSNFLTNCDQVAMFKNELRDCARFLPHNGVLLVVGAKANSSKYNGVYESITEIVTGRGYGNKNVIARCEKVELPNSHLNYSWNDEFGKELKKQLEEVFLRLKEKHEENIPMQAYSQISKALMPEYKRSVEWNMLVFRKIARPRVVKAC